MARLLARLVSVNDGWARPFGEFNHRWTSALFRAMPPIRDLLNGRWLGHPLHAALTDIPIGMLLGVVILDVLGQPTAADIVLIGTIVVMLLSALSGLADYSETTGTPLTRATLHASLMTVSLLIVIVSALMRAGAPVDRTVPIALSIIAFLLVTAGAFVGGDVVYLLGNMVSRHAFRGAGTKWVRLDTGTVTDLDQLPEATPDQDARRHQRPHGGADRGHGPCDAQRVRACRGPTERGPAGRRLHRMPMALLAIPPD